MNEPSKDLMAIAADIHDGTTGFTRFAKIHHIASALMTERRRCVAICEAEREWGGTISDVQDRIASGQIPRQIPGWNCEYKDD